MEWNIQVGTDDVLGFVNSGMPSVFANGNVKWQLITLDGISPKCIVCKSTRAHLNLQHDNDLSYPDYPAY